MALFGSRKLKLKNHPDVTTRQHPTNPYGYVVYQNGVYIGEIMPFYRPIFGPDAVWAAFDENDRELPDASEQNPVVGPSSAVRALKQWRVSRGY